MGWGDGVCGCGRCDPHWWLGVPWQNPLISGGRETRRNPTNPKTIPPLVNGIEGGGGGPLELQWTWVLQKIWGVSFWSWYHDACGYTGDTKRNTTILDVHETRKHPNIDTPLL